MNTSLEIVLPTWRIETFIIIKNISVFSIGFYLKVYFNVYMTILTFCLSFLSFYFQPFQYTIFKTLKSTAD